MATCEGLRVTCKGTYMWEHIILILVSCSSCHGICAEMPVLTMGANMLTPPFTNASPTHSSPLSGYTHHHPNTGSFLFLFSKETAPKKSIFTPLHDKIIVGERVFLVTPVTQCLE